jgi:hypothetical protein
MSLDPGGQSGGSLGSSLAIDGIQGRMTATRVAAASSIQVSRPLGMVASY